MIVKDLIAADFISAEETLIEEILSDVLIASANEQDSHIQLEPLAVLLESFKVDQL
jgi:hypothetical protein